MTITRCDDPKGSGFGDIEHTLKDLVVAQIALGKEVFKLLSAGSDSALGVLAGLKLPKMKSCCDVPEPCWMPVSLGEVECRLAPDSAGEVHFIVTNNDFRSHTYTAQAAKNPGTVQFSPAQATLGPKERTTFTAKFTAPAQAGSYEVLLWILGCRDHYLRWTVQVGDKHDACCFNVTVDDTPDYVVHWYDHFYCARSCYGSTAQREG